MLHKVIYKDNNVVKLVNRLMTASVNQLLTLFSYYSIKFLLKDI